MTDADTYPTLRQMVLDTPDARGLAQFYRELLGLDYRPGEEAPPQAHPTGTAGTGWCSGGRASPRSPSSRSRSFRLGRSDEGDDDGDGDDDEPLYVYADPSGHPFRIFVG